MENWQEKINHIPDLPGVYIYKNDKGNVIYVGKAKRLLRRVKQYFQKTKDISPKTIQLVSEIRNIETIVAASEFDALLLEAKLIRQWMPKYNVIAKDDKSQLYVCLTLSEPLPRLVYLRKPELPHYQQHKRNKIYGPFQSTHALFDLLAQLRHAIPYCTQKQRNGKPCFYTHIGLCNPCPSVLKNAKDTPLTRQAILRYKANIRALDNIFEGKTTRVIRTYTTLMQKAAKEEHFEDASVYKRRIDTLYALSSYKYDPAIFLEQGVDSVFDDELKELLFYLQKIYPQLDSLQRIECFDMSQLFGEHPVGAMVVLTDGSPDTSAYRKFRIRHRGVVVSDVSMMEEVLTRRFMHTDWPTPSFILVDGGKTQVHVVTTVCTKLHISTPYAGLAKRYEELLIATPHGYQTVRLPLSSKALRVLQRVRDEAHRFAITYHRLLRRKNSTV